MYRVILVVPPPQTDRTTTQSSSSHPWERERELDCETKQRAEANSGGGREDLEPVERISVALGGFHDDGDGRRNEGEEQQPRPPPEEPHPATHTRSRWRPSGRGGDPSARGMFERGAGRRGEGRRLFSLRDAGTGRTGGVVRARPLSSPLCV